MHNIGASRALMSRNARSGENGKFDKIVPRLFGKSGEYGEFGKISEFGEFCQMFSQMQMSLLEGP